MNKLVQSALKDGVRLFYLPPEDAIKDYFFGECPHNATPEVAARCEECLQDLRDLVAREARKEPSPTPFAPVGCIASKLDVGVLRYAVSVCSKKDAWHKDIARNMAIDRLLNYEKHISRPHTDKPNFKSYERNVQLDVMPMRTNGSVDLYVVDFTMLSRLAADKDIPTHARRAAATWLLKHQPRVNGERHDPPREAAV